MILEAANLCKGAQQRKCTLAARDPAPDYSVQSEIGRGKTLTVATTVEEGKRDGPRIFWKSVKEKEDAADPHDTIPMCHESWRSLSVALALPPEPMQCLWSQQNWSESKTRGQQRTQGIINKTQRCRGPLVLEREAPDTRQSGEVEGKVWCSPSLA